MHIMQRAGIASVMKMVTVGCASHPQEVRKTAEMQDCKRNGTNGSEGMRVISIHTGWDLNRGKIVRRAGWEGSTCLLPALEPPGTLKSRQLVPVAAPCTSRLDSELISIAS